MARGNDRGPEALRADPSRETESELLRQRDLAERLGARASLLPPADRVLLRAAFEDGRSVPELARLSGEPERKVRRRVERLVRRVGSDRFFFVGRHLQRWPPTRRKVAEAVVLSGLSMRRAARELRLTVYAVRLHMEAVNAMFESAQRAA
jgi:DNA-directed RNA polymerase specialized sigma24 family protein